MHKQYKLLGEFYEENSNAHSGRDYLVKDTSLKKFPKGMEHEHLKDYSNELKDLEIFSVLLPLSTNPYIAPFYWTYRVYIKK